MRIYYYIGDFGEICTSNIIRHLLFPPFHLSSGGESENSLKSFMKGLMKLLDDFQRESIPISTAVIRFLFAYSISIHSTTCVTRAKRMFGRELCSQMDALISEEKRKQYKGIIQIKAFMPEEQFYARDFRKSVQGTKCTRFE